MIDCIRYTTRIGINLHFEFRLDCLYTFQMFFQRSLLLVTVEHCPISSMLEGGIKRIARMIKCLLVWFEVSTHI